MKQVSEQILTELNNETTLTSFNSLISSSPTTTNGDITIIESYEKFIFIKDLLIGAIENGTFEDLPSNRRNTILSTLNTIRQYQSNPQQLITQVDNLYDAVLSTGLLVRQLKQKDYQAELKNISKLKDELQSLINLYNEKKGFINEIDEAKIKVDENKSLAEQNISEIEKLKLSSDEIAESIIKLKTTTEAYATTIQSSEKEIETKKLSINTFAENIEEYKTSIDELEKKATEIIAKEATINTLISQAETALNLKSAQGISAAFSAQHMEASENGSLKGWIIGASVFILAALVLTVWIVSGKWITDPNSISSIVGRVVAVGISITGATFCAKQYNKQKNISEDYAYKAVLAKSIIAFTDEIKKRDDKKVVEYLARVLDEIHKDPLRSRDNKEDKEIGMNPLSLIEKLVDKLPTK